MTLVITELSPFGITMVADSAVTFNETLPSGISIGRVLNGARKLQFIPYLSAGISVWGIGSIPPSPGGVSTDLWLFDFIERRSSCQSIDEFANTLAEELQDTIGNVQEPMGFHLAGYVEREGLSLPTFYHIRNVEGTYVRYEFHNFISGHDFPPRVLAGNEILLIRNGDYGPYANLVHAVDEALPRIQATTGLSIPFPSLQGRMAYQKAWLKFVSDLYASSGILRTIGGEIETIGILPTGRVIYLPI